VSYGLGATCATVMLLVHDAVVPAVRLCQAIW
jgi:hypothetical protein